MIMVILLLKLLSEVCNLDSFLIKIFLKIIHSDDSIGGGAPEALLIKII